ncbi:sigma-70 family RNA polymerase sigma factor [Kitasatospora herbaricolor]|uniref:Sigma-70 family RNA polymerase sigma factor n=1 Tax=Kitasatospora herbaricolor TaxID=68217 RepID=A0ABZ1WGF1_9ACTN|nr:sigma-70 family RNA polymerase sigma factor [Kitasatospora herbaricolor]
MHHRSSPEPGRAEPPSVPRTGNERVPAPAAGDRGPGTGPEAEPEDAELTERLRSGEYGLAAVLYRRHHRATLAHARSLDPTGGTAEDLASEAFTRTLAAVRAGHGPTASWRPYLLAVVRNTAAAWASVGHRTVLTTDVERLADRNPSSLQPDQILASAVERDLVLAAYRTLPERWRRALRHSVVEQRPTKEVARLLGLTGSGASSLLWRAQEGLRRAYLAAHLQGPVSPECLAYTDQLKALARHPARRKSKFVTRHLENCAQCCHRYEEMRDINLSLRLARTTLLAPATDAADSTAAAARPGPARTGAVPGSLPPDGGTTTADSTATATVPPRVDGGTPGTGDPGGYPPSSAPRPDASPEDPS